MVKIKGAVRVRGFFKESCQWESPGLGELAGQKGDYGVTHRESPRFGEVVEQADKPNTKPTETLAAGDQTDRRDLPGDAVGAGALR